MTSHRIATEHVLPERRLKISRFSELNDPFELQPHSLGDTHLRRINRAFREEYFSTRGLICFTESWESPVMWAHYAEKHTGICLGFDIPLARGSDPLLRPVVYQPERLPFLLDYDKDLYGIDRNFIEAMIFTKAHEWSYEQEYRVMAELRERDPETGMFYVDFGPELQLREIILGSRNPTPVGQVAKLVRQEAESVTLLKARPAFQAFKMVPNKAVSPIKVKPRK